MRGHLFENFVIIEALKHRLNKGKENNLLFYRDSNQNEIYLILQTQQRINGYEIKSSSTYHPDFISKLIKMPNLVNDEIGERGLIYNGIYEDIQSDVKVHNWRNFMP